QFATSLGGLPEPEQRTLDELVAAVETERYGPDGFPDRLDRHAAAAMLESVRRTASRPVRWRGRLLPPPVFISSCRRRRDARVFPRRSPVSDRPLLSAAVDGPAGRVEVAGVGPGS